MKKTLFLALIVSVLHGIYAPLVKAETQDAVFRVAAVLPLTGEAASVGQYSKRAIELAYSELPKETREKISLYFEDDSMDAKKSVSAFQMLQTNKHIHAVINMTSGIGHAVAPLAERRKVIMIVSGASDKTFAVGKKHVFIHWVKPENEASAMVSEIKKRDYKKIAMISHIQQGVTAYNDVFLDLMKKEDLADRIVMDESMAIGSQDFNSILAKLRASKADGIYLALFSDGLATFARKVKELSIPGELFGAEFFEDSHVVKASNGALVGAWYVNSDDATTQFTEKYFKTYGEYPGLAAANSYDAFNLLVEGFKQHGSDADGISAYLKTVKDYSGAAGTYSASGDNRFTLPAAVKLVTETGFRKLQ